MKDLHCTTLSKGNAIDWAEERLDAQIVGLNMSVEFGKHSDIILHAAKIITEANVILDIKANEEGS